jgi:type I restriction enzyme S subunit
MKVPRIYEPKDFLIELPDSDIQRKIAALHSAYDDLIENNTRRITIQETMAQTSYREWFMHFRFPGHEMVWMEDSPRRRIPEGWQIEKLGNIAEINAVSPRNGNSPEETHYVDISSVSAGQIDKIEQIPLTEAPSRAKRIVRHGGVIWSAVRPNCRCDLAEKNVNLRVVRDLLLPRLINDRIIENDIFLSEEEN